MTLGLFDLGFMGSVAGGFAYDADALAYITAVEAADAAAGQGGGLEAAVRSAINSFVVGCKADGIWNAIKASCILNGARTLSGALVPLVGTPPAGFNFVDADYSRKDGLGSRPNSNKYLSTGRAGNADPQNSCHLSVYELTVPQSTQFIAGMDGSSGGATELIYSTAIGYGAKLRSSTFASGNTLVRTGGFLGTTRASASSLMLRYAGQNFQTAIASQSPNPAAFNVFNTNATVNGFYSSSRLAFYSAGENIDLAKLDDRVTQLIASINSGLLNGVTNAYVLGDSTIASYLGGTGVATLINSSRYMNDISFPGDTIDGQRAAWQNQSVTKGNIGWVVAQIGLNDLSPGESASTAVAKLQSLVNAIKLRIGNTPVLIGQMIPCRSRLIDIYGATNGPIAYQKWIDMNIAIAGAGATPVTGVDGRITSHVALMNDGLGNLKAIYDVGDGIHPNTSGRQVIADAWVQALTAAGLVV